MTPEQRTTILELEARNLSHYYISACVDGVSFGEIEDFLGPKAHPKDPMSPALRSWWMQQPWVWRPDNQIPSEAPWERLVK